MISSRNDIVYLLIVFPWTPCCRDVCIHSFQGTLKLVSIRNADTLNIYLYSLQILLLMCPIKCFSLAPVTTSYFVFCIFLVNYGSQKFLGHFYVFPTRNLFWSEFGCYIGTLYIFEMII